MKEGRLLLPLRERWKEKSEKMGQFYRRKRKLRKPKPNDISFIKVETRSIAGREGVAADNSWGSEEMGEKLECLKTLKVGNMIESHLEKNESH